MMNTIFSLFNYVLILLYGTFLSVYLVGGLHTRKEYVSVFSFIILNLSAQTILLLNFGINFTTKLYPLTTHLTLVLVLVIGLKKSLGISIVSVLTSYFLCEFPLWTALMMQYLFQTTLSYLLTYAISSIVFFFIFRKYLVKLLYNNFSYSRQSLFLFSILPLLYYLFDYVVTIYTDSVYNDTVMLIEFLPTAMASFYILFVIIYHNEVEKRNKMEIDNTILSLGLEQAATEIHSMKEMHELSRIHRHDMRHHLSLINAMLENGDLQKAQEYIKIEQIDIENFTPSYYCQNEVVNLILSAFVSKADSLNVQIDINVNLPEKLPISKTELCAILSNGLENAIIATSNVVTKEKTVKLSCFINKGNLLIHIENPYEGEILIKDGLPNTPEYGHGYGTRSIDLLTRKYNGYCSFSTNNNCFSLKIVLPLDK